jgi:phosphoribosylamine---glycine ligase
MKLLVIGSGGREHALCWKLAQGGADRRIYCAPGNAGTARIATNASVRADDLDGLVAFARAERIDLTVCGPEAPLCAGIADRFGAEGLLLAGPTAAAAQLEGSKAFAREFMQRHGIPGAEFAVFEQAAAAERYIDAHPRARVVKADGLAAGKGVIVAESAEEARQAARRLLGGEPGQAGRRVVIEEKLQGEEASFMVLSDGERLWPLASSQDHKRLADGDQGPNTGGMGAVSPTPICDDALAHRALEQVMLPAIRGMAADGTPYRGVLYAGLMVAPDGKLGVLEFNCRLGDPETQPVLARLASDLVPQLVGVAEGKLPAEPPRFDPRPAVCVVMAAAGYPGKVRTGDPILGLEAAEDLALVFHAGTASREGRVVTAGGRVLGVTGLGDDVRQARERAYRAVERIGFEGAQWRRDIGARAVR